MNLRTQLGRLLCVCAVYTLSAPESTWARDTLQGWGFVAGSMSGVGLAYREWNEEGRGRHYGGLLFGSASSVAANFGANWMRSFREGAHSRFYLIYGAGAFAQAENPPSYMSCMESDSSCSIHDDSWSSSLTLNVGCGVGLDFEVKDNLRLGIEVPLQLMVSFGGEDPGFQGIYPIPSASLIYYF